MICSHSRTINFCVLSRLSLEETEIVWCEDCGAIKIGVDVGSGWKTTRGKKMNDNTDLFNRFDLFIQLVSLSDNEQLLDMSEYIEREIKYRTGAKK